MPDEPLHPRPQLARAGWLDLAGPWGFAHDDRDEGRRERWYDSTDAFDRTIIVPFPPESPAGGIDDPGFHPIVWYRRAVDLGPTSPERRWILHFGAVDYRSEVWVNGHQVARHEGGHTPFAADITEALGVDGEQVITVRVDDDPTDLAQPRGKQDWQEQPHEIWYRRTTGIWQPVWLEAVHPVHLTALHWTPDVIRGSLRLEAGLSMPAEASLHVHLTMRGETLADDRWLIRGTEVAREIAIDRGASEARRRELLWAPEHPNLVEAHLDLIVDGAVVDTVESYAGLRSTAMHDGRFVLNGRPYFLRLALSQGYWPESHLAAPEPDALRREVELARELGFNGLRLHQKVEDPRLLYWCDRLGVLVWGEMANAYVFSPTSVERLTREWLEVLARDRSHPCIIAWVPLNESWGVPNLADDPAQRDFVRALYTLTKAIDPTRPVIANDGWEYVAGDAIGVHDYAFRPETIAARYGSRVAIERTLAEIPVGMRFGVLAECAAELPVILSECGGIWFRPDGSPPAFFGYGTTRDRDEYLRAFQALIDAILDCPDLAGFCYTQLADTAQETNGLLTADRRPKLDPAAVAAIVRRPSAALAADLAAQMKEERAIRQRP